MKSRVEVGWSDYGILDRNSNGLSAVVKTGLWTGFLWILNRFWEKMFQNMKHERRNRILSSFWDVHSQILAIFKVNGMIIDIINILYLQNVTLKRDLVRKILVNKLLDLKGDQKIMSKIVFLTFRGLLVFNSWVFFA